MDKHGTCSGPLRGAYVETVARYAAQVKIPDAYLDPNSWLTVTPDEVEEAFVEVNPA